MKPNAEYDRAENNHITLDLHAESMSNIGSRTTVLSTCAHGDRDESVPTTLPAHAGDESSNVNRATA